MKRFVITVFSVIAFTAVFIIGASAVNGDLNNDGTVSAADARKALQFALDIKTPTEEQFNCADIVKDGYLNIDDAREILKIAAEIIPVPEHTYSDWETISESTCSTYGKAVCTCSHCGDTKYKRLPLIKHTLGLCDYCDRSFPLEFLTDGKAVLFGSTQNDIKNLFGTPTEKIANGKSTVLVYSDKALLNIFILDEDDYLCAVYTTDKKSSFSDLTRSLDFSAKVNENYYLNGIDYYICRDKKSGKSNDVYGILASVSGTTAHKLTDKNSFNCYRKVNFYLVNQVREMNGLERYIYNEKLSEAAYGHCVDMAERSFFGHYAPEGTSPLERVLNTGAFKTYSRCGENVCAGTPDVFLANNGWYNSDDHRVIILSPHYIYIGTGFYYNEKSIYKYYGVQDFLA